MKYSKAYFWSVSIGLNMSVFALKFLALVKNFFLPIVKVFKKSGHIGKKGKGIIRRIRKSSHTK